MKKHSPLFIVALFAVSCGGTTHTVTSSQSQQNNRVPQQFQFAPGITNQSMSNFFFEGLFSVKNDSSYFYNCFDGVTYPVAKASAYNILESKYRTIDPTTSKGLYAEVRGYLEKKNGEYILTITYIKSVTQSAECSPNSIITGVFEGHASKYKVNINLMGSHKFIANVYATSTNQNEQRTTGSWQMLDENRIQLFYIPNNDYFTHLLIFDRKRGEVILESKEFKDLTLTRKIEMLEL